MSEALGDGKRDDHSQLDAAAILLSLKTTPPSFPKKFSEHVQNGGEVSGVAPISFGTS